MRKILCLTLLLMFLFATLCFADRNTSTITAYKDSNNLVKTGNWKVYRVTIVCLIAGGSFAIFDATSYPASPLESVKAEGQEATQYNSTTYDFTNKPLEGNTGLYLNVNKANVILEYE